MFRVGRSTVDDWLKLRAETGGVKANTHDYRGRPAMLSDTPELGAFLGKYQGSTLAQLFAMWKQEQGQQVLVKTVEAVLRSTFIIDPEGKVAEAMYSVNHDQHAGQVGERLRELQGV